MESVQIWSYFWSVFSYIQTEYRKIRTRNNSVFGHFSRSVTLFEGECKITTIFDTPEQDHQVLGFLPVLHQDDKDDDIFEQESGFTNASETYVNEYCIKKDKN